MTERAENQLQLVAILIVMCAAVAGICWWPTPLPVPITVYEGNYAGFRAIICGKTACLTQRKYCMKFAAGGLWCVDEYPLLRPCWGAHESGSDCIKFGERGA